jgi:hypothetical protein
VSLDPQPDAAAHVEAPASNEALTPELQLAVAFEVLHRLTLAAKSRSFVHERAGPRRLSGRASCFIELFSGGGGGMRGCHYCVADSSSGGR